MSYSKKINELLDKKLGLQIKKTRELEKWIQNKPIGIVETFNNKEVIGWISTHESNIPVEVSLCINSKVITTTWADVAVKRTSKNKVFSFYFAMKDVWQFCSKKDRLSIKVGDTYLPIYQYGLYRNPEKDGHKNFKDLQNILSAGYVFDNFGQLQLSKDTDTEWQKKIIDIYKKTSTVLKENHAITPFLIYGSLLGQVREGGFIGHDSDFDVAYISKHTDGKKVAKELKEIALTLQKSGFLVRLLPEAIHIHSKKYPELKIDLFHLYFDKSGKIQFPYGVAGTSTYTHDDWKGLTKGVFSGYPVTIPKNAEKLVEHIYGASWRIPIAGFNWDHARTSIDKDAHVSKSDCDSVNSEYYESIK